MIQVILEILQISNRWLKFIFFLSYLVGIIFMFCLVAKKKRRVILWLYFYSQIEDFVIDDDFCDDWYMHDFGFIWLYYCVLYLLLILMLFEIHYVERSSYC